MDNKLEHYYGDIIRYLFMFAGVTMLITLPLFQDDIRMPLVFSIIAIAALALAAGFTNPKQISSAVINLLISLIGLITFLSYSVMTFRESENVGAFFLVNLVLSVAFLFSSYFGVKTIRGLTMYED